MMKGQLQWGRCSLLQALVVVAVAWLLPLASSSTGARHWAYTDEALADEVVSLPGAEELNVTFRQFSGGAKQISSMHAAHTLAGWLTAVVHAAHRLHRCGRGQAAALLAGGEPGQPPGRPAR